MNNTWDIFFNLAMPSPISAATEIEEARISICKDKDLSVIGIAADNQEDATNKALGLANLFLDKLSWKYGRHLEIVSVIRTERTLPNGEKIVSHIEPETKYAASIEMRIARVDASGKIVEIVSDTTELGEITAQSSEAAPYYRKAQLSTDVFEKFRNYYLAAENVASKMASVEQLGKLTESQILKNGLETCFQGREDRLQRIAQTEPGIDYNKPLISEVVRMLYKARRCQLSHSKVMEEKKVPFNPRDEKEVQATLPLMEFVAKSLLDYEEQFL